MLICLWIIMAVSALQQPSWGAVTKTSQPAKPKIFAMCIFTEEVCWPLLWTLCAQEIECSQLLLLCQKRKGQCLWLAHPDPSEMNGAVSLLNTCTYVWNSSKSWQTHFLKQVLTVLPYCFLCKHTSTKITVTAEAFSNTHAWSHTVLTWVWGHMLQFRMAGTEETAT